MLPYHYALPFLAAAAQLIREIDQADGLNTYCQTIGFFSGLANGDQTLGYDVDLLTVAKHLERYIHQNASPRESIAGKSQQLTEGMNRLFELNLKNNTLMVAFEKERKKDPDTQPDITPLTEHLDDVSWWLRCVLDLCKYELEESRPYLVSTHEHTNKRMSEKEYQLLRQGSFDLKLDGITTQASSKGTALKLSSSIIQLLIEIASKKKVENVYELQAAQSLDRGSGYKNPSETTVGKYLNKAFRHEAIKKCFKKNTIRASRHSSTRISAEFTPSDGTTYFIAHQVAP